MIELCVYHTRHGIMIVDVLNEQLMEALFYVWPNAAPVIHFDTLYNEYLETHAL
jgi:hypothetical protein